MIRCVSILSHSSVHRLSGGRLCVIIRRHLKRTELEQSIGNQSSHYSNPSLTVSIGVSGGVGESAVEVTSTNG